MIAELSVVSNNTETTKYFKPGEVPELNCAYFSGATAYSYCNKHGLWTVDIN